MSNVNVTVEDIRPLIATSEAEVIVNNQSRFVAVGSEGTPVAELINQILEASGVGDRVAFATESGGLVMNDQVFILRDGVAQAPSRDPELLVFTGDRVVLNRKHTNGAVRVWRNEENAPANSIQVVINNVRTFAEAEAGTSETVSSLLNAVFESADMDERIVQPTDGGGIVMGEQVFILRDGVAQPPTLDGNTRVYPNDRVVLNRKHTNG